MPIAIIFADNHLPIIVERDNEEQLIDAIIKLPIAPSEHEQAKILQWLESLPPPSGYYETRAEAKLVAKRAKSLALRTAPLLTGEQIRDARKKLGLSRVKFAYAIGFNGNRNTVNKTVYSLETDPKATLAKDKCDVLAALLAEAELAANDQEITAG